MVLLILRCAFVALAVALGVVMVNSGQLPAQPAWTPWGAMAVVVAVALGIIALDIALREKRLDIISAVYFGLIVGLLLAYVAGLAIRPILMPEGETSLFRNFIQPGLAIVLCYLCISVLLQTKDDFRFVIPYVEFSRQVKGLKPYVLDTSVVIDGRIADVVETQFIDNRLIMPRFVISELQAIADSADRIRRTRGRRGLDILNRLRNNAQVDLEIYETDLPEFAGQPVDLKLVLLAKHLKGKVVTNDYNLNKVAKLHGVDVVNLNELAVTLKPVFVPGESLALRIVKPGEEPGQGVGYLDDGTMIVVEGGREHVGRDVQIAVTSVLQTSAGRMVFARYESLVKRGDDKPAA